MSSRWEREGWRLDEARARRLPSVEDLPLSGDGYDRAAVEAAFESFYRHAAEVDRTLDVLEAVAAFQRDAGSLRADIRALRAASWGPVPTLRHTVAATAVGRADRGGTAFGAWPRLALYSAFIIFVAVGAAVADLTSGAIVLLVLAAWVLVGLAELAVSGISGRARRAPRGYPAWAAEPEAEEEPETEEEFEELEEPEPVVEAAVEAEEEEAADEEAVERRGWRPWHRADAEDDEAEEPPRLMPVLPVEVEVEVEDEPAEEVAAEAEPEAAKEPEPVVDAAAQEALDIEPTVEPEPEPVLEAVPEPAPEPEPEAEAAVEAEAEVAAELEAEPEPVLEVEPAAEPEPEPESYEMVPPPARQPGRLRFWRRRPLEPPAEAAPSEPRHVRIVDVEPAAAEAVDVPWEAEQPAAEAEQLDAWEREEVPPEPIAAPEAQTWPPPPEPEPEPAPTAEDEPAAELPEPAEPPAAYLRRGRR